jgi:hypothetical protein
MGQLNDLWNEDAIQQPVGVANNKTSAELNNPTGLGWNGKTWNSYKSPEEGVNQSLDAIKKYLSNQGAMKNTKTTPENYVGMWVNGKPETGSKVQNGSYAQTIRDELKNAGYELNPNDSIPNTEEAARAILKAHIRHENKPQDQNKFLDILNKSQTKPSSMRSLWEEEPIQSNEITQKQSVSAPEETMYSPEGIPLVTSQNAYNPRGVAKLAQQTLGGVVSAPVSAALGIAEPIVGASQIANKLTGTKENMANAFNQMQQGFKQASGPMSYATNRPAELAGELGPGVTNLASNVYKAVPLASDLAKGVIAGATTGAVQGALQPTETGLTNEEFARQKAKNVITNAGVGAAFPIAIKGLQAANVASGLNLGAKVKNAPTQEELANEASNFYKQAEQSGIQFDKKKFAEQMKTAEQDLRKLGYVKPAKGETDPYPEITQALRSLQNPATSKNYEELQILRTIINNGASSNNPKTRLFAKDLRDSFDDYVLNAPSDHVSAGTQDGAQAWKDARNSYNKLKKAEVFQDMLEKAEVEGSTKYTQAGSENSLAKQLRQLVNNPKRMRTFTSEEQDQIRSAAVGGNVQNLLKFYGKFAPTSPVTAILANLGSLPLSAGALVSKGLASKIRERDVTNLADMMRLGKEGKIEAPQTKFGDLLKMYEMEK